MHESADVIAGVGLDQKVRKSHWPARLDFVQSASGLFLGLFMWGHMAFVSTILISNDAMYWVTGMFEGQLIFAKRYSGIVGAIVALSPALDEATKTEFRTWGPGKYDPRHHAFDGTNLIPLNSPSLPIVIPPIYGLKGVGFETVTADGPISYWNSYVGVGQMGGQGNFADPRIGLFIRQRPDLVTPKLAALLDYQLSLLSPTPGRDSFNAAAARRGADVFRNEARCSTCHHGPTFTDVLDGPNRLVPFLHEPSEVGMDPRYADRSATGKYRTTPLRGLLQHAPYFHDGSAPDLLAVVNHYDTLFGLNLTPNQKADLVEYLKSL